MNLHSRHWSDLIFENRNKEYGSYKLRITSGKRHFWSFMLVVASFALFVGGYILWDNLAYQQAQKAEEDMMLEQYELLDAIYEEDLQQPKTQERIPTVVEHQKAETSKAMARARVQNSLMDIIENPSINEDYPDELIQNELPDKMKPKESQENPIDDQLYITIDVMPSFAGGEKGLMEFIAKNLRYPYSAQQRRLEKTVICIFFIEKDGSITQAQVLGSVDPIFDKEALRVIRSLPKWKPAQKKGKPIRVKYILPVNFKLK